MKKKRIAPLEAKRQFTGWSLARKLVSCILLLILPFALTQSFGGIEKGKVKTEQISMVKANVEKASVNNMPVIKDYLVPPVLLLAIPLQHVDLYKDPACRSGSYRYLMGKDHGIPFICRT